MFNSALVYTTWFANIWMQRATDMKIIKDIRFVGRIEHSEISSLVQERIEMLNKEFAMYEPDDFGQIVIIESMDTDEQCLQFEPNLLADYEGIEYGKRDYCSPYEFCKSHDTCYELVRVLSDYGHAIVLFVPKDSVTCPRLLSLCDEFSQKG